MPKNYIKLILTVAISLFIITGISKAISIFYPFQGGTGTSTAPAAGTFLIGNASSTYSHLTVGNDGELLHASSTAPYGVEYTDVIGEAGNPLSNIITDNLTINTSLLIGGSVGVGGIDFNNQPGYNASYFQAGYIQATSTSGTSLFEGLLDVNGTSTLSTTTITDLTVSSAISLPDGSLDTTDIPLTNTYVLVGNQSNYGEATSSLVIDNNGNVGIGTTTPLTKLDIYNGDIALSSSTPAKIMFYTASNKYVSLQASSTMAANLNLVLPVADGTIGQVLTTYGNGVLYWSSAGAGDVLSVGDCASGACFDGSSDGGTYLMFYDGDSNWIKLDSGDASTDLTLTLANATGTLVVDATACTDIEGTGLSISGGVLNWSSSGLDWNGNSISDLYIANDLAIVAGDISNTPIGSTTPSTAIFTNTTTTNATTTGLYVSGTLNLPNDSITDAMLDWGNFTDLSAGGQVDWGNITAGELTNDSVIDADIDDDGNFAFTGSWDFGSGVLEITNGASPTVDAAGEIALDTTDNQLLVGSSGATSTVFAFAEQRLFSVTIASTSAEFVSGGILPIAKNLKDGREITQFRCYVDGGTSIVVNVSDGTNDTETITCATTVTSDLDVVTNATFTADEKWELQIGTITGEPDYLIFEAYGYITPE